MPPKHKPRLYAINQRAGHSHIYLDDGFRVETHNLSDDEYKRALRIGISQMLANGELKPEVIGK